DGEIRLCKWRMRPVAGWLVLCGVHKALVLRARDRTDAQLELIDEDAMRRPLVLVAKLGAHGEPASRDLREGWGDRRTPGHRAIITRHLRSGFRMSGSASDSHSRSCRPACAVLDSAARGRYRILHPPSLSCDSRRCSLRSPRVSARTRSSPPSGSAAWVRSTERTTR